MRKTARGFTLIELLVVISILAILAVVGAALYSGVSKSSRDSKRKADIQAIAKAYETNYQNGSYQTLTGSHFASGTIPQDPAGGGYFNIKANDGSGFKICTALDSHPSRSCNSTSSTCYCLTSSQGTIVSGTAYSGTDFGLGLGDNYLTHNNPSGCDSSGTLDDGLIGYWKLDGSSVDLSGNNYNGTIMGGASYSTDVQQSRFGQSVSFNGTNAYISLPPVEPSSTFTLTAWVKVNALDSQLHTIIGYSDSEARAYKVAWDNRYSNQIWFSVNNGTTPPYNTLGPAVNFVVGQWYFIAATYNSSRMQVFLNNNSNPMGSMTPLSSLGGYNSSPTYIGRWGSSYYFNGLIDDVRVYSRVLSGTEIIALFNNGNGCLP